ncbi:hypothetical protein [Anaerotignum sp.]|uniref:hypothetical protein n=1 Tax=Anaerotignum sp. TaxID=2039241 RepID=UPI0028A25384|nr:hypothetical protein [Anaerotignum sp.]
MFFTNGFFIVGVLMFAEYLLCTKLKSPLWGGILPILIFIGSTYVFASGIIPLEPRNLLPFLILNILFFGDWATGRDKYKKIQQAELEKMRAKDIN